MLNVTCAIIFENGKFLITQRGGESDHPFQWEFPGGKLKNSESFEEGIKREISEELELEIAILQKMTPVIHDYGFKKIKLIPFLCTIDSGEIHLNEHVAYRWINFEELDTIDFSGADKKLINLEINRDFLKKYSRENMNDTR